MFKYVRYEGQWIIFMGGALLDPSTVRVAVGATEAWAIQIVDALNYVERM